MAGIYDYGQPIGPLPFEQQVATFTPSVRAPFTDDAKGLKAARRAFGRGNELHDVVDGRGILSQRASFQLAAGQDKHHSETETDRKRGGWLLVGALVVGAAIMLRRR